MSDYNFNSSRKYRDFDAWSARFAESPDEERIGCINALNPNNFENPFDPVNDVEQVINTLFEAISTNDIVSDKVETHASWKAIQYLEAFPFWGNMRQTVGLVLVMLSTSRYEDIDSMGKVDRRILEFLERCVYSLDPENDDLTRTLVNTLQNQGQLHLFKIGKREWRGNPVVISQLFEMLNYGQNESIQQLALERGSVVFTATVESLLFHLVCRGELNERIQELSTAYSLPFEGDKLSSIVG